MTFLEETKILAALTGPPGVGKSIVGRMLAERLREERLKAEFVDEYQFVREYAELNRGNTDLVTWRDREFTLTPRAYNYVTAYSSSKVAGVARRLFLLDGVNVVVYEGARGAFGVDNYRDHFFDPTMKVLGDIGGFQLANIEVSVRDLAENRRRMQVRFEESEGGAAVAPPWILERYINEETGMPWANPVAALQSLELEGVVVMNKTIFNDGDFAQVRGEIESIARELCGQPTLMEGGRRGLVEQG